jgi:hypothetical protein
MDNNDFYVWDNHRKVWASNPDMRDQTEWFVWDPHSWWEFNSALIQGVEWFPRAEIYRGVRPPGGGEFKHNDQRKKVALLFFEHFARPLSGGTIADSGPIEDHPTLISNLALNWADIVVTHSTEAMNNWWPRVYGDVCNAVHSDRIKCVFSGSQTYTSPPADRFFTDQLSFFSYVVKANTYRDISSKTVPFRKYMFDILMGTVKTARTYLMYRLLESDFIDHCIVNLQPRPWDDQNFIARIDPKGHNRHGIIQRYSSPALAELEEPVVQQFKQDTQDQGPREQYSVNLVYRPGHNLPGDNTPMSVIVPWGVYQSSWYSVVCETADIGSSNTFLTEKTAKCLFAKRIFIMFNCAGLLKRLKELGFRTFHGDIIDESYDNEPNDAARFGMAWQQIHRLYHTENPRAVYEHFQDTLEHNHQHILNLSKQQLADIQQFIHTPFALEQTKMY